jgi:hypothetical protein
MALKEYRLPSGTFQFEEGEQPANAELVESAPAVKAKTPANKARTPENK